MLEFLGYIVLILTIVATVFVVVEIHNYLTAFICFWIGLTIGSMLIISFKKE